MKLTRPEFTADDLRALPDTDAQELLKSLGPAKVEELKYYWPFWARANQLEPEGKWRYWLLNAGRGFGKSRVGSEWVRHRIKLGDGRIACVAPTKGDVRRVMVEGEALCVNTKVPTPTGWTTMGQLEVGDKVYAKDGTVTEVIAKSPVWKRPTLVVEPRSGSGIVADLEHKWEVEDYRVRRTKSTNKILKTKELTRVNICGQLNYRLPTRPVIQGDESFVEPIPAYTLGAWLGDGAKRDATFTQHADDFEVIERINADGFTVTSRVGDYEWGITDGLSKLLRDHGLKNNKHIPQSYLRAGFQTRLKLLQGLMDTDGSISERGQCEFCGFDYKLVADARELALTLGYKVGKIQSKPNLYRFVFTVFEHNPNPFHLSRKASRVKFCKESPLVSIQSVTDGPETNVVCIQVSHSSGTFICSEDFVVTHNSGLLNICWKGDKTYKGKPLGFPIWSPTNNTLTWENGAKAEFFSAEDPERLRGPQFHSSWCDELAAWNNMQETWDMLQFCLRLGKSPRVCITTTPKPVKLIRWLMAHPETVMTTGSSYDNSANIDLTSLSAYEGTRLGRQELYAEVLDEAAGALWNRELLQKCEIEDQDLPETFSRVVVSVDPAVTSNEESDMTGIIVAGMDVNGTCYILRDATDRYTPEGWATKAVELYYEFEADRIVAERNQGGEMVRHTIHTVDDTVPVRLVHASKGKMARAEPVSALYERGKVFHVKGLNDLEDQMVAWEPLGSIGSPDRLDALVWACTDLALKGYINPDLRIGYTK